LQNSSKADAMPTRRGNKYGNWDKKGLGLRNPAMVTANSKNGAMEHPEN
jgi:hypothetical protein